MRAELARVANSYLHMYKHLIDPKSLSQDFIIIKLNKILVYSMYFSTQDKIFDKSSEIKSMALSAISNLYHSL